MTDPLPQEPLTAPIPTHEAERLAALHRYQILDTPPEAAFDRITKLAARLFDIPVALISLVDESRAWFKSCVGFAANEVPRDNTLCSFAVLSDKPLIVPDTRLDDRFVCNPFVQAEPGVRFYAGAPLLSHDSFNLGTLCLLDSQPRNPLTSEQQATLVDLAAMVVDELELRLAAQNVAQSEEKYRTLFDSIDEGFCICEMLFDEHGEPNDYRFLEVNPVFEQLAGLAQAIGKRMRELAPNHEAYWFETYGRVVQTREPIRFENYASALNRWFNVNAFCVGEPHNNQFAVLFTNITEAKRTEADRKQAEAILQQTSDELESQVRKFDATLSTITDPVFTFDREGRFLYANQVLLDLWGLTAPEAINKTMADLNYPPAVERQVLNDLQRVLETRESVRNETPYINPSGVEGYFEYILSPLFAADHTVESVVGLSRDVSDRKRAETALRQSEEQSRNILESIAESFFALDQDWRFTYMNQSAEALLDRSPGNLMGKNIWDEYPGLAGNELESVYRGAMRDRTARSLTAFYPDHDRWYEVRAYPAANGIAVYFNNVTERKAAEAEREKLLQQEQAAREEAQRANRIKDEFLAVLSHELRSPLNPILGWSKLLQKGKLDANKTTMALETIERNAQLQAQLIDDLLDISRILQGKLTLNILPVHLSFVVSAALETVQLAIDAKAIQLHLDIDPAAGQVLGDAARLRQVVWNLLSNAAKFTPPKGQITISLSSTDHQAQIQVSDTGKGINPEFLPYVFEHFRQEDGATTRKFGGLGLGLAIVRQIVELHGGSVWAESLGEGKGATFTVQLPTLHQTAAIASELTVYTPERNVPLAGVQVLLVDDEPNSREFQAFVLEQCGATVTAVASGAEALQVLEQWSPDVLVSDIGMPELDGYMLLQQIRTREASRSNSHPLESSATMPAFGKAELPAIALTAYAAEIDHQRALQVGFQRHITKPIQPEALVQAVASLLERT